MLEIRNVHKTFNLGTINEKHALNGVNLKLDEGDFVTVIGGNGAGKSTMLNAVAGTWPVRAAALSWALAWGAVVPRVPTEPMAEPMPPNAAPESPPMAAVSSSSCMESLALGSWAYLSTIRFAR